MKKTDGKKAGIIALVLIAAVAIIFLVFQSGGKSELQKQLELGQKYLEDMDYEQAVAAFNKAIELNPKSADAYIGLADAYVGLGDIEAALAALQEGYEITGDERIQEYIDSLINAMEEMEKEQEEIQEGSVENLPPREEWLQFLSEIPYFFDDPVLLTYEEREAAWRPFVPVLQEMIDADPSYNVTYDILSNVYLALNEPDNCLEIRRKGYENTGDESLRPEYHEVTYYDGGTGKFDAYGQISSNVDPQYNERHQLIYEDMRSGDSQRIREIEYDSEGRTARVTGTDYDKGRLTNTYVNLYIYGSSGTVTVESEGVNYFADGSSSDFTGTWIETFDEYGNIIETIFENTAADN